MATATVMPRPLVDVPAVAAGAAGCILVGASFPVSALLTGYPIAGGQSVRYGLAALALAALLRFRLGRPSRGDLARLAAVAVTGMLGFNLFVLLAVGHADPSLVGAVVGSSPVLLALAAPTRRLVVCAATVVAGALLVRGTGGGADAVGLAAAGGALVCEVLFSVLMAPVLPRLGVVRASAWACILACGMLALIAPLEGVAAPTGTEVAALGYLACFTVAAFVAWYFAVARLGVGRAGLLVGLMPVSALAVSAALGHEAPGAPQVLGVLLVGAGVALGLRVSAAPAPGRRARRAGARSRPRAPR